MRPSTLALLLPLALAPQLAAGGLLRVGPTQAHKTIQSAVDAAATGDLILVDAGTYPAFVVNGKGISIVAATTAFTVTTGATVPAIDVTGVAYPLQVSIIGARIDYASKAVPAVHLHTNTGSVRFSALDVDLAADLCSAAQTAAVLVEATRTFWFIDSRIFTATARRGSTTNPIGPNDGISGIFVRDSDGTVQNCQFAGYDACGAYSGDGMRMTGNTSVWIVDDYAQSPERSIFRGGTGGQYGGNALHYLGAKSGLSRISMCGRTSLEWGRGSVQNGGFLALNNDGGQVQPNVWRLPSPCAQQSVAQTSADAAAVPLGGNARLRIFTLVNRSFVLVVSDNSDYVRNLLGLGLAGRGMVDVFSPLATILTTGRTTGGTATVLNLQVPVLQPLVGLQLTFQSLVGPVNGVGNALSFPSMVVLTR